MLLRTAICAAVLLPCQAQVFFSDQADAEISFVEGGGFILKQGARNTPARKL